MSLTSLSRALNRPLNRLSLWLVAVAIAILSTQSLIGPAWATGVYQMPAAVDSDTWLIDDANQVSRLNEGKISSELSDLAEQTGNEVRFVTIHRLDYGETPQSFADQLAQQWFSTPEAAAKQTVIVLDDVTNNIGIHVGSAAADRLTPDIAESVTEETMKVPLRNNNQYNQAFLDATDRLVAVLSGKPDPGPPVVDNRMQIEGTFASAEETEANRGNSTILVVVLLIAATVIPMATYYWYQSIGG